MFNLRKVIQIGFLSLVSNVATGQAISVSSQADNLKAVADVIRAEGEYARALSEAQLNYARTELELAKAAGEWQRARQWMLRVNRLQLDLRRVGRDEAKLRRKIEGIEKRMVAVQTIFAGNISRNAIGALRYLQIHAFDPKMVFATMTTSTGVITLDDFLDARTDQVFVGENVGQLIDHIYAFDLKVKPWSNSHQLVINSLILLIESAAERLVRIRRDLDILRESINPFELK